LRAKTGPHEAGAEGFGYSKVEADNEIWPGFRRNPGVPSKRELAGVKAAGTGWIFPDCFVARRSNTPGIPLSSLRALVKISSRRCQPQSYEQALGEVLREGT
jgi:hypothetical protein